MDKYKTLHIWMIIPMVLMQAGIFQDYWGDFSENAWSVHVHYWTGTTWYLYLIIQPYYATHGQLARHSTNGIVGIFLAGGVCLTALSMMHRDIQSIESSIEKPEQFGPFQPWFFFGVIVVEIVMMTAFGFAVIKGIIHRKQLDNHAWWLTSSVFIIMMPALARGISIFYVNMHQDEWPNVDIMVSVFITQTIIIALILLSAWKYGKLKHPATLLAVAVNAFIFLLEPIGRSESVQQLLKTLIKG